MKIQEIFMEKRLKSKNQITQRAVGIQKVVTYIEGLDEILQGGLPAGRTTLIGGGPGTGKTIFGLEFLYRGALSGNAGIFISFEETAENIRQNALSLGWDLPSLEQAGKIFLIEGQINPEATISGDFNLKGLLAIIEGNAKELGAGRVVIDALDGLMRVYNDSNREYQQIFLLHNWLKKKGLTAVLTTKNLKETNVASAYDYLDFMADCVIYLDQRIRDQVNTKRLQVIKYRGSDYGHNEYPFLITGDGIFVYSISEMALHYESSQRWISSGNPSLDKILGGGYQQGTAIIVSGASGTGKTTLASSFARSTCENGQKVIYVNFEESQDSMVAGMLSLGIDLRPAILDSALRVMSVMPESKGIEEHLYDKITAIKSFQPEYLVVDAISACKRIAGEKASFDFVVRLIHFCKENGITVILINQSGSAPEDHEISGIGISSIIDTVITLHYDVIGNEANRTLRVIKSRGIKHSNKYHKYELTDKGIQFKTVQPEQTRVTAD
jgi:circadian clock protein KaiC